MLRALFTVLLVIGAAAGCEDPSKRADESARSRRARVLFYGKETEWFHDSNDVALRTMLERGKALGWETTSTKDSAVFTSSQLADNDVVVFLLTSGMTMSADERAAFQSYVEAGHGFVGVHSASHTDYDWPFMQDLVGAKFCCHSPMMPASVHVEDPHDPLVAHLPPTFVHVDEWYGFDRRPEADPNLHVLLAFDESSAGPDYPSEQPALRVGYHPITWRKQVGGARSFYTALGHPVEAWSDDRFVTMVVKAIEWAAHGD